MGATYSLSDVAPPSSSKTYSLSDVSAYPDNVKIGKDAFPDFLKEELRNAGWFDRNLAAAGTSLTNLWEGAKQMVGQSNQDNVRNNQIIRSEAPVGAIAGDVAATMIPLGLVGASVKGAGAVGAGYGALQPVLSDNALDVVKGKAINSVIGGASAAGGQAVANRLFGGVNNKISNIEQKVNEKAAQVAASETASARSAAGNAAQDAYRQLEHLRELGANRALTAEEKLTYQALERELAEKALDKLMPAAARKQATSDAYKEAMSTEAERAAQYAADKLSTNEMKQQFMARLKRYGPAVVGGALGHWMMPGVGTLGGAAGGLYLRPAIRSMINLTQNPAVQHGLLTTARDSALLTSPAIPASSLLLSEGLLGQ